MVVTVVANFETFLIQVREFFLNIFSLPKGGLVEDIEGGSEAEIGMSGVKFLKYGDSAVRIEYRPALFLKVAELPSSAVIKGEHHRGAPSGDVDMAVEQIVHRDKTVAFGVERLQVLAEIVGSAAPGTFGFPDLMVHQDHNLPHLINAQSLVVHRFFPVFRVRRIFVVLFFFWGGADEIIRFAAGERQRQQENQKQQKRRLSSAR